MKRRKYIAFEQILEASDCIDIPEEEKLFFFAQRCGFAIRDADIPEDRRAEILADVLKVIMEASNILMSRIDD